MAVITAPTSAEKRPSKTLQIETSREPAALTLPQKMGTKLWLPMFAMALMGFVVALILAAVRSSQVADGDVADLETLRHLTTGFMFLGFTGVFAAISFAIARILGVFRVVGGAVQHDVGDEVQSLKMPATGRTFIGLMMMGMMAVLFGSIMHIIVGLAVPSAAEADLVTSEKWFLFGEGLRRVGVGLYLVGITFGLATIISVIRFQAIRIRQLT
jgi:hypothetical protein